ncbi:probable pyruvate dehydrogenase E1 component subunit alpha, mitochondrial isoform X2 [Leptopilina heterotoma]|uniref:probable pyruvate dehydrogenase E1 component subunit alpha, mitochondrial isoform X2 n=1 Tax=Leptopilina heterotoma TaxID=63436 RepID=UPI001CA7E6E4|nr:probable pyruvate dehydrogenase E1 component subunit alpha, mitochondrial isoform X2 [Leptopilina heterotoma]
MIPTCLRTCSGQASRRNIASFFKKNNYATEVSFETKPFRLHKLEKGPSTKVSINKEDAMTMYTQLHTIRRLETAAGNLYKEKIVRGFCHLYSGQEAVAVGIMGALRKNKDSVITAYRAHGWTYLMGVKPAAVLAELTGKQSGSSHGKGGSMHLYAERFYGGNGIVGAQVPLGVGVAFAHKYKKDGGVCVALYGDGAANQGQIFEVYNMAKLWDVPCIFVCENNGYGMGTSVERSSASTEYYTRGDYVPGIWVDGMDVLAVREATRFAVDHCTSGKGPIVMETATYRYSGHSMSDPGTSYRTREEIQEVRQTRDPITGFKDKILSANLVTAEELKKVETEIRKEIDEAVKLSKSDKEAPLSEVTSDVYAENLEPEIRNVTPFNPLKHNTTRRPVNL